MPKGPQGQKRPADAIGCAVLVGKIATGERSDEVEKGGSAMTTQIDRAVALLFPENGRRAMDIKFFCQPDATEETLAEQIIVCMAALDDPFAEIANVDQGLIKA